MKKLLIAILFVFVGSISVLAQSYNDVKNQEKPVVVMFHMHGCSACKHFEPFFDKISSKFSNKFNFVKEDINKSDIAKTLNFQTVPALFIIEPKTMHAEKIDDNCAWDEGCFAEKLSKF